MVHDNTLQNTLVRHHYPCKLSYIFFACRFTYGSSIKHKRLCLVIILSLAVIGRYLTTINHDWDCRVSLGQVYNILEAHEQVLQVKLSTVLNVLVWMLMSPVLILSVRDIKKLALRVDAKHTNKSLWIALGLLAYEMFAVCLNYLTWSGELLYLLQFLQVIPTLAVVLHIMSEIQFLLAEGWDYEESINSLYFAIINISLNIAMMIHLCFVAFFIYDYLTTNIYLMSIGITLALFKLGFRVVMIMKYWRFYHALRKPTQENISSTGELVLHRRTRTKCCAEYVIPKPLHSDYKVLVTGY